MVVVVVVSAISIYKMCTKCANSSYAEQSMVATRVISFNVNIWDANCLSLLVCHAMKWLSKLFAGSRVEMRKSCQPVVVVLVVGGVELVVVVAANKDNNAMSHSVPMV